jgi:hypothetical protein
VTIIVGVKCTDGVVIGSDSIATSAVGVTPIMQLQSNDKIRIFGGKIIIATTGSVGFTQRFHRHVEDAVTAKIFTQLKKPERAPNLSHRFLQDLRSSSTPYDNNNGFGFGALLAAEFDSEPCLVEYDTAKFQPEFKEKKLFFAAMGSGQPLADPFLAFVSRVLWKDTLPDVRFGRFGLYWALSHTIGLAPGLVGGPIKMAVLTKNNNVWSATMAEDNQESSEFIASLESRIGAPFVDPPQGGPIELPPTPSVQGS